MYKRRSTQTNCFHRRHCLPCSTCALSFNLAFYSSLSSVSVLMLIMPPIKIYIKSYDATRSHASDQSPGKAETVVRRDTASPRWLLHHPRQQRDPGVLQVLVCVHGDGTKMSLWFFCQKTEGESVLHPPGLLDQVVLRFLSDASSDRHTESSSVYVYLSVCNRCMGYCSNISGT